MIFFFKAEQGRNRAFTLLPCCIYTLIFILEFSGLSSAEPMNLTGTWQYQSRKDTGEEWAQSYSAQANRRVDLSQAMNFTGSVRYNRSKTKENTIDTLQPTLAYNVENVALRVNLTATANEQFQSSAADTSRRSVGANIRSIWKQEGFKPQLSITANQGWQKDDLSPHLSDNQNINNAVNLSWNFDRLTVFTGSTWQNSRDHVALSESTSQNYLLRLEGKHAFWQDRGQIVLSQKLDYGHQKNVARTGLNNQAQISVATQAYYNEIDPTLNLILPASNNLINNDKTDAVVAINSPALQRLHNFGIHANFQDLGVIYIYTDSALSGAEQALFVQWDIYTSPNNTNWTLAQSNAPANYDAAQRRFNIDISGLLAEYIKVVATVNPVSTTAAFSELEVFQIITSSGPNAVVEHENAGSQTDLSLNLQLTPNVSLTSNASLKKNTFSNSPDLWQSRLNSALRWQLRENFSLRIDEGYFSTKRDLSPADSTRSGGITFFYTPLPTLDTSYGLRRSEVYRGSSRLTTNTYYDFLAVADLFSDLQAQLDTTHSVSENNETNAKINSTDITTTFTARLIPSMVADWTTSYTKDTAKRAVIDSNLNLNWRPSELMTLSGSFGQTLDVQDTTQASLRLNIALTSKVQTAWSASSTFAPESSFVSSADLRWILSDYLSFQLLGEYFTGLTQDGWRLLGRLNARYQVN